MEFQKISEHSLFLRRLSKRSGYMLVCREIDWIFIKKINQKKVCRKNNLLILCVKLHSKKKSIVNHYKACKLSSVVKIHFGSVVKNCKISKKRNKIKFFALFDNEFLVSRNRIDLSLIRESNNNIFQPLKSYCKIVIYYLI